MHVFILTGEPSGDLHGANLALILRKMQPHITLRGVGGQRMRQAGVDLVAESEHWGAIGIPDALKKVPFLWGQMRLLTRMLCEDPPDVLVLIDFGAFNVHLLKRLQGMRLRTVYFIPPGCWARNRSPGRLPFLVDAIATPFSWSADNLHSAGAPCEIVWVGHPLLEYTSAAANREEARQRMDIDAETPVVLLVPGSRRSEIRYLLSTFYETVRLLPSQTVCLLATAPSIGEKALRGLTPPDLDVRFIDGIDYQLAKAADAALTASGTATLELACLGIPMAVAYRGSFGTWLQYKYLVHMRGLRQISLPNILAEDYIVPEYLQKEANPQTLAAALTPLFGESSERSRQLAAFTGIRSLLGDGHSCEKTARLVMDLADGGQGILER